jgi:hypothetical protein
MTCLAGHRSSDATRSGAADLKPRISAWRLRDFGPLIQKMTDAERRHAHTHMRTSWPGPGHGATEDDDPSSGIGSTGNKVKGVPGTGGSPSHLRDSLQLRLQLLGSEAIDGQGNEFFYPTTQALGDQFGKCQAFLVGPRGKGRVG